ncbi:MAG: MFS transporter [Sporolactobacillus sp.]
MKVAQKRRLSIVLYLNYVVHGMGLIILAQNMRELSAAWATPLATVSYVMSGIGIGRLIAYYAIGSLSDRYGRKVFITFGMISYFLFLVGILFTSDFRIAYLFAILAGIANSALDSGTYPTFLEMADDNGSANILIKAAMSLGEFVLPLFIGMNDDLGGWYGYSFLLAAALLLINLALISRTPFPERIKSISSAARKAVPALKMDYSKIGLVIILSIYGYTSMALMIWYTQWITLYGTDVLHMPTLQAHFLLSLYSVGSITGVLLLFVLLKKQWVQDKSLIVWMNGLSLLILAAICYIGNPLVVSIGSFLFGLTAASGVMQIGLNLFLSLFPEIKGRVTGIFFSFGSIASFSVPIISGQLSKLSTANALRSDLLIAFLSFVLWIIGKQLLDARDLSYQKERRQINHIDHQILKQLQKRFKLVEAIGRKKSQTDAAIFDPAREAEITAKIDQQITDQANRNYYHEIFRAILTHSKQRQSEINEGGTRP